jgi:uncharacterized coiled-coil DUF342 family protein
MSLSFLNKNDDKLTILFKHYETIMSYQHAFEELIKRAKEYRQQEEHEGHWAIKTSELGKIQYTLDEMRQRALAFNQQFDAIKTTVIDTFQATLNEYVSSVDTYPEFGIDRKMGTNMKSIHTKLDALMSTIDQLKANTTEFKNGYDKQLSQKKDFYDTQSAWEKRRGHDKDENNVKTLEEEVIKDIHFGAQ